MAVSAALLEAVCRQITADDPWAYLRANMLLAHALEHIGRYEDALAVVDRLQSREDAPALFGDGYWWMSHVSGLLLRQIGRYDEARRSLETVGRRCSRAEQRVSSLHHIGVIDLQLGDLEKAQRTFRECLRQRSDNPWNYRRAYEFRRLGQVHSRRGRIDAAGEALLESLDISRRTGNLRYVRMSLEDLGEYVVGPRVEACGVDAIDFAPLCGEFGLEPDDLPWLFRGLRRRGLGFLEEFDGWTMRSLERAIAWDVAHCGRHWHHVVSVVATGPAGQVLIQRRGEEQSRGRWDISVSGHVEVAEAPAETAARETREELGISISADQLESVVEPGLLRKIGHPAVVHDRAVGESLYLYRTDKRNYEWCTIYRVCLSHDEVRRARSPGLGNALDVELMDGAALRELVEEQPATCASALKQALAVPMVADRLW